MGNFIFSGRGAVLGSHLTLRDKRGVFEILSVALVSSTGPWRRDGAIMPARENPYPPLP